MIYISKHTNQLCNRLFTYLPVISYALEAGEPVCFLFQYEKYDAFFPNLKSEGIESRFLEKSLTPGLACKLLNASVRALDKIVHLVLRPGEKIPLKKPLGCLFNPKWKEVRYDKAYIAKHADKLRFLFTPTAEVCDTVARMLATDEDVVTVGVHIRGGDYRTYLGGRYFYEPAIYREYMSQMAALLAAEGKRVRFLVCTNEPLTPAHFEGLQVLQQAGTDMMVDLYGLSQCDYIIGPPSTFSQWASFYGKTPLRVLASADEQLSLDEFKRVVALDTFE